MNVAVKGSGGTTLHDVVDDRFARKAVENGADGLIAVATGAGGHAGRLSPFALIQEIRQWFDGPLALSGTMVTGQGILAAQAMGADSAYIGSAFIATLEANAVQSYKDAVVEGRAQDIVYSIYFTVVHGNYLKSSIMAAELDPEDLPVGDRRTMNFGGDSMVRAWRDIWGAGQSIGAISNIAPVSQAIARWEAEYSVGLSLLNAKAGPILDRVS